MSREFSRSFYKSSAWLRTRESYISAVHGLCESCLSRGRVTPGVIVHHKIHLSPENINDPEITLSHDNLELVCRDCHAKEHPEIYGKQESYAPDRVAFDEEGNIVYIGGNEIVAGINVR